MDSSEKRKLIPTGTAPKKAEKRRKKTSESGCSSQENGNLTYLKETTCFHSTNNRGSLVF